MICAAVHGGAGLALADGLVCGEGFADGREVVADSVGIEEAELGGGATELGVLAASVGGVPAAIATP